MPSHDTFTARVEALKHLDFDRPDRVPDGYPDCVMEPWVWSGSDFVGEREDEFVVRLSEEDVLEVEMALGKFKGHREGRDIDPDEVSKDSFQLPKLQKRLEDVADELHCGIGFVVIRGLEPRRYTTLDNILIYLGITSFIAPIRGVQDSSGNMLSRCFCEHFGC